MFSEIRYQQQYKQIQSAIKPGIANTPAKYGLRSASTGLRQINTPDGGIAQTKYLSNSQPDEVLALSQLGTIGLPGYITQKPY